MNRTSTPSVAILRMAGGLGFTAVALGAFGAHGLAALLSELGTAEIWETAVFYHVAHAIACLWAARESPLAGRLWFAGVVVFSGSLYVLALTGVRWLGAITPLGGLLLLAGWAVVLFTRRPSHQS